MMRILLMILALVLCACACGEGASRANIRKCGRVCDRATLSCAAQQSNAEGMLGCEAVGRMCAQKCANDYPFRMRMARGE